MFDTDEDYNYVPEIPCNTNEPYKPKLFDDYKKQKKNKWNTGIIVDYSDEILRPMTEKERQRAKNDNLQILVDGDPFAYRAAFCQDEETEAD